MENMEAHLWSKKGEGGHPEIADEETTEAGNTKCQHCWKKCANADGLEAHLWSKSGEEGHPVYENKGRYEEAASGPRCQYCPKWFKDESGLDNHMYSLGDTNGHLKYVEAGKAPAPPTVADHIDAALKAKAQKAG